VRDDLSLEWPFARTQGSWLTFGFDQHLGLAARIAVDGMLDLMEREHGLSRRMRSAWHRSSSTCE
jgi:acetamidase/formamidase